MTINDLERFKESLPDWAMLAGCWGEGRIEPTDIDGAVERRGVVLFLEHKSSRAAIVKRGQEILYEALAASGHVVVVFWSEGGERNVCRIRCYWRGVVRDTDPATLEDLRRVCTGWYRYANSRPREAAAA